MIDAVDYIGPIMAYGGIFFLAPAVVFMALAAFTAALTFVLGLVVLVNRALVVAAFFAASALVLWLAWLVGLQIRAWRSRYLTRLSFLVYRKISPRQVGEKAYRLGLAAEHFDNIPPGWVLTARAYRLFLRANKIKPAQNDPMKLTVQERQDLARAITEGRMPLSLERYIARCLMQLGDGPVVVRSSFFGEDGQGRSYSGIFNSFFTETNDTKKAIAAIKKVWASYYDERVADYIGAADDNSRPQIAGVLIQKRVAHEVACIATTVDIVDRRPQCIIADISDAMGTALPAAAIDRITGAISYAGQERAELTATLLHWLSANVENLEMPVNGPAQIECGVVGDRVYLYQIRPLSIEIGRRVLVNSYLVELPPYPLTPLSESIIARKEKPEQVLERPLWQLGFTPGKYIIVRKVAGRFYADWRQLRLMQRELLSPVTAIVFAVRLSRVALFLLPQLLRGGSRCRESGNNHDCQNMDSEQAYAELLDLANNELPGAMDVDSRCATLAGLAEEWALALYRTRDRSIWPLPGAVTEIAAGACYSSERAAEISQVELAEDTGVRPAAKGSPRREKAELPDAGIKARLIGKDGRGLLPWRGMLARLLIAYRNRCLIARERSKQNILSINYRIQCLIGQIAKTKTMGQDLVYYLSLKELGRLAIADVEKVEALARQARKARRLHRENEAAATGPVVYIDSDGRLLPDPATEVGSGDGLALVGYTGGDIDGVARFVDSDRIDKESVLFLPDAESGRVHYLVRVKVLIAGSGGPLSHLAIVARELGVPFAVAAGNAVNIFNDGDRVVIDSRSSRVRRVL